MQSTDEILLKRIEERDEKAFSLFYEKYSRAIFCFVLSKVHDVEASKEIVQNFWVTFWENPRILRANKEGSVKVFMFQYLRFRIYDMYRVAVPETIPLEKTEAMSGMLPDVPIEKEELVKIVNDALQNSSLLTKNTFWERVEKVPAKEVAAEHDVTTQTVHNTFSRALKVIRKHIQTNYPELMKNSKAHGKI